MPTTALMPLPKQQYFSALGTPLLGGKLYTFAAGTSTPKETYTDSAGTAKQPNPIPLNLRGEPDKPIFWSGNYRVELRNFAGDLIYSVDNYNTDPAGVWDILNTLLTGAGSATLGYISSALGSIKRTVQDFLRENVSLLDFMTDEQRTAVYSGDPTSHQTAFDKAAAYMEATKRTVQVPPGTYNFENTFAPNGGCFNVNPKAILRFTSTVIDVIRVRRGVSMLFNGCELTMTNAAWNGNAVVLDGEDHFLDTYPTVVTGATINSTTFGNGTGLLLRAQDAGDYIAFVHLSGFNFGRNLNYAYIFSCGTAGSVDDSATWHYINSNKLLSSVSSAKHCSSMTGLPSAPAEVTGNIIQVDHQTGADSAVPHYFSGASSNTLSGWVWDWDNTRGSPIVFEGGAVWNNVKTNVDTNVVTTATSNKVEDMTGGETGQKYFFGLVQHMARSYLGVFNKVGQYALTWFPDATGSIFHAVNRGPALSFMVGADPYGVAYNLLSIREDGSVVVGDSNTNPTISTLRVNGAATHSASAIRVGADGAAGILFENAAGTASGSVVVNTTSTTYGTSSDYRLKKDVEPLVSDGSFINSLRPVRWTWKINGAPGIGFIAHELQAVSPTSVTGEKNAEDAQGNPIYQAVEYGSPEVIAHMVLEMQKLRKDIDYLKNR